MSEYREPIPKKKRIKLSVHKYRKLIRKLIEERGDACDVCGRPGVSAHHVIHKSQLGDDSPKNLRLLCHAHHRLSHGDNIKEK